MAQIFGKIQKADKNQRTKCKLKVQLIQMMKIIQTQTIQTPNE